MQSGAQSAFFLRMTHDNIMALHYHHIIITLSSYYPLVIQHSDGNSPYLLGKTSAISMALLYTSASHYQRVMTLMDHYMDENITFSKCYIMSISYNHDIAYIYQRLHIIGPWPDPIRFPPIFVSRQGVGDFPVSRWRGRASSGPESDPRKHSATRRRESQGSWRSQWRNQSWNSWKTIGKPWEHMKAYLLVK